MYNYGWKYVKQYNNIVRKELSSRAKKFGKAMFD